MARQVLENGVILPAEYSDDWYDDMTSNLTKLDDVIGSDSEKLSSADVGAAALSNSYNDLDNLPTIPTVNDATLTIQKNGVDVQTFTANASSNVTANITVPTKTSDLTNDSNFVDTSNPAVSSGITSAKVTDYDTHIADTDIHVTTADKTKWNNGVSQAYVFRYSSTALIASSTNSNTLLDNTDNLKVGDKVIDSDGVLFSVTAIDTANSTFTIGSALIDLALDGNVVHTSGNETIAGDKVFNNRLIKNIDVVLGTAPSTGKFSNIDIADNNKTSLLQILCGVYATGSSYARFFVQNKTADDGSGLSPTGTLRGCGFNISLPASSTSDGIGSITPRANKTTDFGLLNYQWRNLWCEKLFLNGTQLDPSAFAFDNAVVHLSGNETITGNKTFSSINGVEPSSLSLPSDRSARIDISSYITNLGNGDVNVYAVPANGYIWLHFTSINSALCYSQTSGGLTSYAQTFARYSGDGQLFAFFPVRNDDNFVVQIYTSSTAVVQNAYFIPCQGNI